MRTKVATDLLSPLRSHGALRPGGGRASGVAFLGRATPYTIFRRALGRGNLMGAEATIDELALAASCLAALTGNGYPEAAQALRDMAEKATRRRRGRSLG
jgi:hypothetical protein